MIVLRINFSPIALRTYKGGLNQHVLSTSRACPIQGKADYFLNPHSWCEEGRVHTIRVHLCIMVYDFWKTCTTTKPCDIMLSNKSMFFLYICFDFFIVMFFLSNSYIKVLKLNEFDELKNKCSRINLTLSGPSFQINVRSGGGGQYCPPRICHILTQVGSLGLTKNLLYKIWFILYAL